MLPCVSFLYYSHNSHLTLLVTKCVFIVGKGEVPTSSISYCCKPLCFGFGCYIAIGNQDRPNEPINNKLLPSLFFLEVTPWKTFGRDRYLHFTF